MLFLLLFFVAPSVHAQQNEQIYLYDSLGRLIRAIKPDGTVATYSYDAVGNLLAITSGSGGVGAPTITGITPSPIRAGEGWDVVVTGTNLLGGSVQTSNTGIKVLSQKATDTSISARFLVALDATVGITAVIVTTPLGQAGTTISVDPPLLSLSPSTLVVNKGKTAAITATMASSQSTATTIDFKSGNPGVATSTASVTILAGQLSAQGQITGVNRGFADISASIHGTTAIAGSISVTVYDPGTPAALVTMPVSVNYPHLGTAATGGQISQPISVNYPHLGTAATGGQISQPISVNYSHLGTAATGGQISQPISINYPHLGTTATGGQVTSPVSVDFTSTSPPPPGTSIGTGGKVTPPVSVVFNHLAAGATGGWVSAPVSVGYSHLGTTAAGGKVAPPVSVVFNHLATTATGGMVSAPVSVGYSHLGTTAAGGKVTPPVSVVFNH
ncbi:MAG: hypothetical protein HY201_04955, partial [Nitrospirae bacterium]|nr:hypothetical protein [Candidatus Troglogloeales bacterium]